MSGFVVESLGKVWRGGNKEIRFIIFTMSYNMLLFNLWIPVAKILVYLLMKVPPHHVALQWKFLIKGVYLASPLITLLRQLCLAP